MPNLTKPWLPDYQGPNEGWALWVHHDRTREYCTDFAGRIAYCEREKPARELPLRRRALTFIPTDEIAPAFAEDWQAYIQLGLAYRQFGQTEQTYRQLGLAGRQFCQTEQAYLQARQDYEQARQAYLQARRAFDQASMSYQAYDQAEQAYIRAEQAHTQAGQAYGLSLAARYAPDIPHINGVLRFEET
jgi:tetratricopeptide (TPR) repeat protein